MERQSHGLSIVLKKEKEERKILMVISDGAPVDDSTLSVNSGEGIGFIPLSLKHSNNLSISKSAGYSRTLSSVDF